LQENLSFVEKRAFTWISKFCQFGPATLLALKSPSKSTTFNAKQNNVKYIHFTVDLKVDFCSKKNKKNIHLYLIATKYL